MHLTDEQWLLIQPHIPPPSPSLRGRPPVDECQVLDGIFTIHRLGRRQVLTIDPRLKGTWQLSIAFIFLHMAIDKLKSRRAGRFY